VRQMFGGTVGVPHAPSMMLSPTPRTADRRAWPAKGASRLVAAPARS